MIDFLGKIVPTRRGGGRQDWSWITDSRWWSCLKAQSGRRRGWTACYRFTARLNGTSAADAEDGEPTSHFNHLKLQGAKSPFIITISLYGVLKKPWMWGQQASQNNTKTSKLNLYFWLAFGLFLQILHILSFRKQTMLDSNFSNSASRQRPHRMNDYS